MKGRTGELDGGTEVLRRRWGSSQSDIVAPTTGTTRAPLGGACVQERRQSGRAPPPRRHHANS